MSPPDRLRILFASPAYWPAVAFGGPVWMARELNDGMTRLGHSVAVMTTSLLDLERPGQRRTRVREVEGVTVHYLATPLRYRWMGITPTLPVWLARQPRPDVVHVFGYRDPVGTGVAAWARAKGVPYVFEPLGMFRPKWRKVALKRLLDAAVGRRLARDAAVVIATSEFERSEIASAGIPREHVVIRGNGFPPLLPAANGDGRLRRRIGVGGDAPVVLFVGRIAHGKGIEVLLEAGRALPDAHLVLLGPEGADGTSDSVRRAQREPALAGRVHLLPPTEGERPLALYAEADVFVLPSRGESFGMVAAEAAAAGTACVVSDRCGIAEVLRDRGALVVPYGDPRALRDAIARLLADDGLRGQLAEGGRRVAGELSWPHIVRRQEAIYRDVVAGRR